MSSTHQPIRSGPDSYQTPVWCVLRLLEYIKPIGRILEPCRGDGNIEKALTAIGLQVDWCEILEGRDYFQFTPNERYDWIVTNPPFNQAERFVRKALIDSKNVAMLLRINFLGAQKRKPFWDQHPVKHLLVHSQRPDFTGGGGDSCEYGWFIWSDFVERGITVI